MKHNEETRRQALAMMKEVGAKKTHEQTGISLMTLYKWRNSEDAAPSVPSLEGSAVVEAARALLSEDHDQAERISALERQVAELSAQNAALSRQLADETYALRTRIAVLKTALSKLVDQ